MKPLLSIYLLLGLSASAQVAPGTYHLSLATNSAYPGGGTETLVINPAPATTPPTTNTPPPVTTPPPTGITDPAQATAAGFTNLVFDDEFTTTSTIAPNTSAKSGYNWYPYAAGVDWTVNTGAGSVDTAGATGVLTITASPNSYNEDLQTVPISATGTTRTGTWQHAYCEARMQYAHVPPSGKQSGWPSFWGWAVQALSPKVGQYTAEDDFLEFYPISSASGELINTLHNWANTSGSAAGSDSHNNNGTNLQVSPAEPIDDGWHIYGCLWTSTGSGTGSVQFYFDNQLITHSGGVTAFATGTGTGFTAIENDNLMIILGTATGRPVNVDWVRVWQN